MTGFSICDVCSLTFPHGEIIPEKILVSSKSVAELSFAASRWWPQSFAYSLFSRSCHWLLVLKTVLKEFLAVLGA